MRAWQAICVCNSRELAVQNLRVIEEMGQFTDNKPFLCVKDVKLPKKQKLKNHMLIGTPGSIINAMRKKCFDPKLVGLSVLRFSCWFFLGGGLTKGVG